MSRKSETSRYRKLSLDDLANRLVGPPSSGDVDVDREEIIRAELESAIRIYVNYQDAVSAHLLTSAASEIMKSLSSKSRNTFSAHLEEFIRSALLEDEAAEALAFLALPYNFCKHGSSNLDTRVHFKHEFVHVTIANAISDFSTLFGYQTKLMIFFLATLATWHPDWFDVIPEALKTSVKELWPMWGSIEAIALARQGLRDLEQSGASSERISAHP